MLLLWLAMVCMIPFDLKRLDSNIKLDTGEMRTPVMDRIIEVGKVGIRTKNFSIFLKSEIDFFLTFILILLN